MKHLNDCLAETNPKRWRRVHGALALLEQVLQRGARSLVTEIAEGQHFDLVQRLTFLERYDYGLDLRVQQMVRQKANALRADLLARTQGADVDNGDSNVSGGGGRSASSSAAAPRTDRAPPPSVSLESYSSDGPEPPKTNPSRSVNGIVSVGHRDDTDTE